MIEIKNEYKNWTIRENDFQPEYLGKFETIFNLGLVLIILNNFYIVLVCEFDCAIM